MTSGEFTAKFRHWALAPLSTPPAGQRRRGKLICNYLDVAENDIIETISLGVEPITLQNKKNAAPYEALVYLNLSV